MPLPIVTFAHDATTDTVSGVLARLRDMTVVLVVKPLDDSGLIREIEAEIIGTGEHNGQSVVTVREGDSLRLVRIASIQQIILV